MCKKRKLYLQLFIFSVFLTGCEYVLKEENVLNIEKPGELHRIDLSILPEADTIFISEKQVFDYAINTYGLKFKKVEFRVDEHLYWEMTSKSGSFTLDPMYLLNGVYKLSMKVYTNSGTGSLADKLGGEGFWAQRIWTVKISKQTTGGIITPVDSTIDNSPTIPIRNVKSEIIAGGYLKFSWPKVNRKDFYCYRIYWNKTPTDIVHYKANDTTYIDSTYFGGPKTFRVDYSRLHDYLDVYGESISLNDAYPVISVTGKGLDSVTIHWTKSKYRVRYEVKDETSTSVVVFKSETDTRFTLAAPPFGSLASYTLYVTPRYMQTLELLYYKQSYASYNLGTEILSNHPVFACNPTEKVAYAVNYDAINCYTLPDMTLYKKVSVPRLSDQGLFACPTNSSKVAALSSEYIYVFNNKSLTNPVKIPYPCWTVNINYLCLTNNDIVGVATSTAYDMYRVTDQTLLATIPITDSPKYSPWCSSGASSDGKYFAVVTLNGIHLYKIENTVVTEVYSDKRPYFSVLFDPTHPERFYVTLQKSNEIEMRSSADFSLIKTYVLPGNYNILQNLDPETGYLLLTNYESNYLYDLLNEKIVFNMANDKNSDFNPRFYYGNIFSSNGRYLNIVKYIKP